MDILRFITAGSVDDGKSTLIGRLLYDSKNLKEDILSSVQDNITDNINLAYITDGLRAERNEGITIDVAYKYFTTANRKYIITDAPGHFQYTKNLVTGASGADAIIILIDAQNGITAQTKLHSMVASFLGIKHVAVAINKMDLFNYDERIFKKIQEEYKSIQIALSIKNVDYIPVSALNGDNVIFSSDPTSWYDGPTLMEWLEECSPLQLTNAPARLCIQNKLSDGKHTFYTAWVISGTFCRGDDILIYPNETTAQIKKLFNGYNEVDIAYTQENISVYLDSPYNIERGDIAVRNVPTGTSRGNTFVANLFHLSERANLFAEEHYIIKISNQQANGKIEDFLHIIDTNTLLPKNAGSNISVNEFARVKIKLNEPLWFDKFEEVQETGRGIIVCPKTYDTIAAFTIA